METMDAATGDKTIDVAFFTPEEGLDMLIDQVEALGLSKGNENSLTNQRDGRYDGFGSKPEVQRGPRNGRSWG